VQLAHGVPDQVGCPTTRAWATEVSDPLPLVTVVIPARNEEQAIAACLEAILHQDYDKLEVLVIDGGSTDRTRQIVNTYSAQDPRVRLISGRAGSIPRSLNAALATARGTWLVRVDGHSTIPSNYVSTALSIAQGGGWVALGGRKEAVATTPLGLAIAAALGSRFGVGNSLYHYGTEPTIVDHIPFGVYLAQVARDIGGWDERLTVNEDFEFDQRVRHAGFDVLFDPRLVVYWRCRETIRDLFRQYMRYGAGKPAVAWLHPRSLQARHLAPPALVLVLGTALIALPRRPRTALVLLAPYLAALMTASLATSADVPDRGVRFRLPVIFAAMHVGYGLGVLKGVRVVPCLVRHCAVGVR